MARSPILPKPDALDRTIMARLNCLVGPEDPALFVYDVGELKDIPTNEYSPLALLFFHALIAPPSYMLMIYTRATGLYKLQLRDPFLIVPSLMLGGQRRRLSTVNFADLHGVYHTVQLPALPDPGHAP